MARKAGKKSRRTDGIVGIAQDRIHERRMTRYYLEPPYGNRYWMLSPFIADNDYDLRDRVRQDFGSLEDIRPMFREDLFD